MWNTKCLAIPVITGATGILITGLKYIWEQYQESIQQILYKKASLLETPHIIRKLEARVVGCSTGSRGEVPGKENL
jgi:hypothetical protein